MEYRYHKQIVDVLLPFAGKGLKLQAIARYIYNENNTLFEETESFERLYQSVQGYLTRQSRQRGGSFAHVPHKRGWFRVRPSVVNRQKLLDF
jgi:hypothetical protein